VVETTGPAVALGLEVHPSSDAPFVADGETAWPITLFALDAAGRRVPDADLPLAIEIDGPAELLGVGNGDPNGHFANRGPAVPLFRGLAQVIVRATTAAGRVTVRAVSPGIAEGVLQFETAAVTPRPSVATATRRVFIADWQTGPVSPTPPDIAATAAGADMNTWERIKAGGPQAWPTAGYRLYRATLKPPKAMAGRGGRLVFERVDGEAEVFLDGDRVATGTGRIEVELPVRTTPAELVIRLHGAAGDGMNGPVEIVL
jgi:beta-galactosidase